MKILAVLKNPESVEQFREAVHPTDSYCRAMVANDATEAMKTVKSSQWDGIIVDLDAKYSFEVALHCLEKKVLCIIRADNPRPAVLHLADGLAAQIIDTSSQGWKEAKILLGF